MGNKNKSSPPSVDKYNNSKNLSLDEFQEVTKRKMTLHILSDKNEDCKDFIYYFTNEKVKDSNELSEKDIKKK